MFLWGNDIVKRDTQIEARRQSDNGDRDGVGTLRWLTMAGSKGSGHCFSPRAFRGRMTLLTPACLASWRRARTAFLLFSNHPVVTLFYNSPGNLIKWVTEACQPTEQGKLTGMALVGIQHTLVPGCSGHRETGRWRLVSWEGAEGAGHGSDGVMRDSWAVSKIRSWLESSGFWVNRLLSHVPPSLCTPSFPSSVVLSTFWDNQDTVSLDIHPQSPIIALLQVTTFPGFRPIPCRQHISVC